jgi:hypothetical protein
MADYWQERAHEKKSRGELQADGNIASAVE